MALKSIVAAGLAALSLAFAAGSAEAKTKVIIGIGGAPGWYGGGYCYNHPYRCRPAPRPLYYNYYVNPGPVVIYRDRRAPGKMSCGRAADLVADRFNRVAIRECNGPVYSFTASRNGKRYLVRVDAFARAIISANRI